ncbi:MAG: hypothetical protein ACI9DG_000973 [Oleispira sp.]|jgi:hypothetical protein
MTIPQVRQGALLSYVVRFIKECNFSDAKPFIALYYARH